MPTLTPELINAIALDAANRSMRKAGRTALNEDDWNCAYALYIELMPKFWDCRPEETKGLTLKLLED